MIRSLRWSEREIILQVREWATLRFVDTGDKVVFSEIVEPSFLYKITTATWCFTACLLFLSVYYFILNPATTGLEFTPIGVAAIFTGVGLIMYAVATRGFKAEIGLDRTTNEVWICRRNSNNHARIVTYFNKSDVCSFHIKCLDASGERAYLVARLKGKAFPTTVLRGKLEDIKSTLSLLGQILDLVDKPLVSLNQSSPSQLHH